MRTDRSGTRGAAAVLLSAVTCLGLAVVPVGAQFVEADVNVLYTLSPATPGEGFGWAGAALGDVSGDGVPDFAVTAHLSSLGGPAAGAAFIYSGADGTLLHTVAGASFNRLGYSVAGIGDVDLDGVPDYAVGGPALLGAPGPQPGRVLVLSGADHSVIADIAGPTDRTFFGFDLNKAGDVNGDGRADLVVGAPLFSQGHKANLGQAHVFSAHDGTLLWTYTGTEQNDLVGAGISGLDDLDGDGIPEQAAGGIGAGAQGNGRTFVIAGADGSLLDTLKPVGTDGGMGYFFVHDAGDVDADGVGDIFVGDFSDENGGRAYVFSGADRRRLRVFNAEAEGDGFGIGRGAGDVDGDGRADVFVAAYLESSAAFQGGKAYLFSGARGDLIRTMTGTVPGAQLGFDALPVGDVNADGKIDFLITGIDVAHVVAGN